MKKPVISIIGNGFVGEAHAFAFSPSFDIKIFDIDKGKSNARLEDVHKCDFVFVCVPTPTKKDGHQNLEYIEKVFQESKDKPIYIIKSTILPGTTQKLAKKFKRKIVFSPEFLTQRNAKLDMLTQARIILGGEKDFTEQVRKVYEHRFKNKNIIQTDSVTAELVKYMNNTFFATKVSIMNEFKLISDKIGADWEKALYGFASDCRIGDSHLNVPGHDGKLGYGGKCFPKDVSAFINFAKKNGIKLESIIGGWNTNLKLRKDPDWNF